MLRQGKSCRAVARALGVSRQPICDIRNGVGRNYHDPESEPVKRGRTVGVCPVCRFKVVLPCVKCYNAGLVDENGEAIDDDDG